MKIYFPSRQSLRQFAGKGKRLDLGKSVTRRWALEIERKH